MKKIFPLLLFTILCILTPFVLAAPILSLTLSPEPQYYQVWAYETYLVNMSVQDLNLTLLDFSGYTGVPSDLLFDGVIRPRGIGGYDYGNSTTGYTYDFNATSISVTTPIQEGYALFNFTMEKDGLDYGMKPYENVQITLKFNVYVIMNDSLGPKIASNTYTFNLIDETKVLYLEGKYEEMQGDINTVIEASGIASFDRDKYRIMLASMNDSLTAGNYVEALDIWSDYDEDDRAYLIRELVRASDKQFSELQELRSVKNQLLESENDLASLHFEYDQLEKKYATLYITYQKVNAELEVAKRNLTTAITVIFLTAIVFYFLGHRGIRKKEESVVEPIIH